MTRNPERPACASPGGHDVVVVDDLDEGLEPGPLSDGLRGRLLDDLDDEAADA